jgi:uncharacterized protein YbjT (DUF2867 family)
MIAVMGSTGKTGGAVARRLLAAGRRARAIGRSAARLQPLVDLGATPAVGDVTEPGFLASVFEGVEAVYAMIPLDYSQPDPRRQYNRVCESIAAALTRARVGRVVFLSSLGAELEAGTGPVAGLHDAEVRLASLGIDVLNLRPGYFYENLYAAIGQVKQRGVNGGAIDPDAPVTMIATGDIGNAAAEELLRAEFRGVGVRELLGPRDYTMTEATRILGQAIGKPDLAYVRVPDDAFVDALTQLGFSRGVANALLELSHALSTGRLRSLEGRSPRTTMPTPLETFAREWAAAYRAA